MIRTNPNGSTNHDKCAQGRNCMGPGCRVKTGKTNGKSAPKKVTE